MRPFRRPLTEQIAAGSHTQRSDAPDAWVTAGPAAATVALVGRPNVGKSTLFNRLVRRRQALMHDRPGVTRDRIEAQMGVLGGTTAYNRYRVRLVDTGGLTEDAGDELTQAMQEQTFIALKQADIALLVVDAQTGLTAYDRTLAQLLRRANRPWAVVVNKVDVPSHDALSAEFFGLGAEHLFAVSAEHARGLTELTEHLAQTLEGLGVEPVVEPSVSRTFADEDEGDDAWVEEKVRPRDPLPTGVIRVAVVGRPNAGKSSLINALLQQPRLVASAMPGTTRDAVDTFLQHNGRDFVLIDTAGIRRKRNVTSRLEALTVSMAFSSLDRCDVALLVLDGTERPSDQDGRIAEMAHEKGCGLVVVGNKWDLVENPEWKQQFLPAVKHDWPLLGYAPLVTTSATKSHGLDELFEAIVATQHERHRRITTGELNRFFREVVEANPPPVRGGRRPQLMYVSQPLVGPPTFVFSTRGGGAISATYRRYLQNALRQRYGFAGTPLWIKFRTPSKADNPYI